MTNLKTDKAAFTTAMLQAGRDAMVTKLTQWFGKLGATAAEDFTTEELVDVLWGFVQAGAKSKELQT